MKRMYGEIPQPALRIFLCSSVLSGVMVFLN